MLFFKLRTHYAMYWNVPRLGGGINNIWHFILLWGHNPMWLNISPPWSFVIWSIIWKVCHVKQLDVPSVSCKTTWCTICRWVLSGWNMQVVYGHGQSRICGGSDHWAWPEVTWPEVTVVTCPEVWYAHAQPEVAPYPP